MNRSLSCFVLSVLLSLSTPLAAQMPGPEPRLPPAVHGVVPVAGAAATNLPTLPPAIPALPLLPPSPLPPLPVAPDLSVLLPAPALPLPAALRELVRGTAPRLDCASNPLCALEQTLHGTPTALAPVSDCHFAGHPALHLQFGALPPQAPAGQWLARQPLAVRCPPGVRYRVQALANGRENESHLPVQVGTRTAWLQLRADGAPLHEHEFIGDGQVQTLTVEAWLLDEQLNGLTPRQAGAAQLHTDVRLALVW